MPGILDVCVPSRRRERRRQRQIEDGLHSRFGDTSITAPNEGGWSQPGPEAYVTKEWTKQSTRAHGSPDTEKTLVNSSPVLDLNDDNVIIVDDSYSPPDVKERNAFTITIPLPWSAKKPHSRAPSTTTVPSAPIETAISDQLERSPSPPSKSPPVVYKPASEAHLQELANLGVYHSPSTGPWNFMHSSSSPPSSQVESSRSLNASPVFTILSPVNENFAKGTTDRRSPSPVPTVISVSATSDRSESPPSKAIENFSRPRLPSPQISPNPYDNINALNSNPPTRAASTVDRPHTAGGFSSSGDRIERPSTSTSNRPPVQRPGTAMSSRSIHTGRSSSRGPAEDRISTITPSTSPHLEEQNISIPSRSIQPSRSSSRGPTEDRIATTRTRSASRGPGLDRTGYMRSSSREPGGRRAVSREPATRRRTSSRGPAPSIRRAASVEPSYRRVFNDQRDRDLSDNSSDNNSETGSFVNLDLPVGKPSLATTVSSTNINTGCSNCEHCNCSAAPAKLEYEHVGRGENLFSETEDEDQVSEASSGNSGATSKAKRMERLKDKIMSPFIGAAEMVPDGDDLWS